MEEKIYTLKAYGETKKIRLQETAYVDGTFAIAMYSWNEEYRCWEPWDVLTVNLPQTDKKGRKAFVTGGNARSGYNHYTEIEFI